MKILIVDDNPQRYSALAPALDHVGVGRSELTFAGCANDARSQMEKSAFDLVVFDILIPLWPDTEADRQNSVDLLADIINGDGLQKPRHVVGISADPDAAAAALPYFSGQIWAIIAYSESDDSWLTQLLNCIVYIRDAEGSSDTASYGVDLAVICALPNPELSEVLKLPWNFAAARPMDDLTFVHDGKFTSEGKSHSVAAVAGQRMGMVSLGLLTARVIQSLRPRLIVMTGICAGVEGEVKLGDVIFIDPSWDWQSGKYIRESEQSSFDADPHQLGPTEIARAHAEQIKADKAALAAISVAGPDEAPGVLKLAIAPVACGSGVIADDVVVAEIKFQSRKVAGIEMEAYGVFAAAEACSGPRPAVMALKGVCDFADPRKNDKIQRYAAYASARVMQLFVERYFDRLAN